MTNASSVASLGPAIPHPLLAATGRYAGLLPWNIDRAFPQASQWLESKFPLWAFSVLEDWAAGVFDQHDAVVFSRGDDASQRLYYYLCELRRRGLVAGPEPLILDVARIPRPGGEERCTAAIRQLGERLGVDGEAVERTIAEANAAVVQPQGLSGPVCLLAGTLPPDRRLHTAVAAAGWSAAGKTMREAWGGMARVVHAGTGDPFAALGQAIHSAHTGARSFHDRRAAIVARARKAQAAAALLWYAEEDEAEVWNLPAQRDALAEAGVPTLVLTRRSWRFDDGAPEEIAAFLEGMRLKETGQ